MMSTFHLSNEIHQMAVVSIQNYGNFESFFRNLAQNQELKFVVFSEGNTKDCVVRFTGNDAIKNYRFVITDSNNALLKDWLKTKSK